jgi:hypothetical protein
MCGKIISLDLPGHLYKSVSYAGRGYENPIFADLPS